jgi:hypothetical protein
VIFHTLAAGCTYADVAVRSPGPSLGEDGRCVPLSAFDYTKASGVARDRREGYVVYYGDAADPAFLEACGSLR